MSDRAEALAKKFEQAITDIVSTVEGASDEQWRATCGDEGWTVAATAHHVGSQWPLEQEYLTAAAEGRPAPAYTWDDINGRNAKHAQDFPSPSKADVTKLLRDASPAMASFVRGLSDEQLDRTMSLPLAGGAQVSTQQLIEGGVLIEHATAHLQSIRNAK